MINALQQQNQQVTAGQIGMPPAPTRQASSTRSTSPAGWTTSAQFENIVVKTDDQDGQITRLRDVARVELGAQTYSQVFTLNGKPAAGIGDLPDARGQRARRRRRGQRARWPSSPRASRKA